MLRTKCPKFIQNALICLPFLIASCTKKADNVAPAERKSQTIEVHDLYDSDSIIYEYPDGKRIALARDSSKAKPTKNSKVSTWPDQLYNGDWPLVSDEVADPYFLEEDFDILLGPSYVPLHCSWYAGKITWAGEIIGFTNVFVLIKNPTAYYMSSGRSVQRTAEIMGLTWHSGPLPSSITIFSWDYYINCYYTYTPWYTPQTRQYHYTKSLMISA